MMRPDQALSSVSTWAVRLRLHILGSAALGLLGGAYHARQAAAAKNGRCGCYGSPVFVGEYSTDVEYDLEQASTGAMSTGFLVQSDVGLTARLLYEGALKLTPMDEEASTTDNPMETPGGNGPSAPTVTGHWTWVLGLPSGERPCQNTWSGEQWSIVHPMGLCEGCEYGYTTEWTPVEEGCFNAYTEWSRVAWPYMYNGREHVMRWSYYEDAWYPFAELTVHTETEMEWYYTYNLYDYYDIFWTGSYVLR